MVATNQLGPSTHTHQNKHNIVIKIKKITYVLQKNKGYTKNEGDNPKPGGCTEESHDITNRCDIYWKPAMININQGDS